MYQSLREVFPLRCVIALMCQHAQRMQKWEGPYATYTTMLGVFNNLGFVTKYAEKKKAFYLVLFPHNSSVRVATTRLI